MELGYALIAMGLFLSFCASDGEMNNRRLLEPYDFLFDTAVEAYVKGDWLTVILNMEKALKNKATVRNVKAQCRLTCANYTTFGEPVADSGIPIPGAGSVEDLGFFQKILKRADCVNSCEAEKLGLPNMHKVSEEVELEFKKRTPYNYLQVAYFKVPNVVVVVANVNCCNAMCSYEAKTVTDARFKAEKRAQLLFISFKLWQSWLQTLLLPRTRPCHVLRWSQSLQSDV